MDDPISTLLHLLWEHSNKVQLSQDDLHSLHAHCSQITVITTELLQTLARILQNYADEGNSSIEPDELMLFSSSLLQMIAGFNACMNHIQEKIDPPTYPT